MEEIQKLVEEIERLYGLKQISVTTFEIAKMIENREQKKLFEFFGKDERHTLNRMFLFYDRKGRDYESEIEILFVDDEYVVVRATQGEFSNGKKYYGVWVFGREEGKWWVHRLPWSQEFEEKELKVTKEWVKKKMGFQTEIDEAFVFNVSEAVRVQGDLVFEKVSEIDDEFEDFEERSEELRKESKQIQNFVGNHLVIVEKGKEIYDVSSKGWRFAVLGDARVFVIHDEHENKSFVLDKGIYDAYLLRRWRRWTL